MNIELMILMCKNCINNVTPRQLQHGKRGAKERRHQNVLERATREQRKGQGLGEFKNA